MCHPGIASFHYYSNSVMFEKISKTKLFISAGNSYNIVLSIAQLSSFSSGCEYPSDVSRLLVIEREQLKSCISPQD